MSRATRWIAILLIGTYVLMATLEAVTMTAIRISGTVPASAPIEQAAYFLTMPWLAIIAAWISNCLYVASLGLLIFGRRWTTRLLTIAVAIDLLGWLWARTATSYADVFSPTAQALDALLFAALIVIVVLMMIARRTDTLT